MMATERRRAKTETLSLRLDPKTKFVVDFVARIRGQAITTVVERAIKETAEKVTLDPDESGDRKDWASFWDPIEGVRTLNLLASNEYPTDYDQDERRAFTLTHWQFFYTSSEGYYPHRTFVDVLWPNIKRYLEIWREKKTEDYWAAGEAMKADLTKARVKAPDWPPEKEAVSPPTPAAHQPSDLDDEIAF